MSYLSPKKNHKQILPINNVSGKQMNVIALDNYCMEKYIDGKNIRKSCV